MKSPDIQTPTAKDTDPTAAISIEAILANHGIDDSKYLSPGNLAGHLAFVQAMAVEKEHYNATHDALTGLPNRRALDEKIEGLIERKHPFAYGLIDVNKFKSVNDKLGHTEGDELLVGLANEVFRRDKDTVYRFGGDEFVALLEFGENGNREQSVFDATQNESTYFDTAFDAMLQTRSPELQALEIGVSIGWAYYDPSNPTDAATLYKTADASMYDAKRVAEALRKEQTSQPVRTDRAS